MNLHRSLRLSQRSSARSTELPPSVIFVASASTRNPKANHRIEPMQLDAKTTLPKSQRRGRPDGGRWISPQGFIN
jgi:hypothetical protein